jgi:imidazolonepropionase-like amidohydrolase
MNGARNTNAPDSLPRMRRVQNRYLCGEQIALSASSVVACCHAGSARARHPTWPSGLTMTSRGQGIADAMDAGVDSIEHCTFFTADGVEADPEVIAELGRRRAVVSITGGTLPGTTPRFPAIAKRSAAIRLNHAALHRAGARIVCGTDAGVGPNKPHDVLRYGVSNFASIGMTNAEALRANTSVAAAACGIDHRKGAISVGKDADLLAVAGNPLDNLSCIENVRAVIVKGHPSLLTP